MFRREKYRLKREDLTADLDISQRYNPNPNLTVQSKMVIVTGFDLEMVCTVLRIGAVRSTGQKHPFGRKDRRDWSDGAKGSVLSGGTHRGQ